MRAMIEARLAGLRAEAARGEQALAELDARRDELARTMLRISGAAQVLEETLAAADASASGDGSMAAGSASYGDSIADASYGGSSSGGSGAYYDPAVEGSAAYRASLAGGSASSVDSTLDGSASYADPARDGAAPAVAEAALAPVAA